jgi:hypothetical protein
VSTGTSDVKKDEGSTMQGGFSFGGRSGSAKEKRTLHGVKTSFYCGTEDGEIVYVDWMPQKDQDTGKIQSMSSSLLQMFCFSWLLYYSLGKFKCGGKL